MKVLQICSKPPIPIVDGGCKAMDAVTQGLLTDGIAVKVLSISTAKHPFDRSKLPADYLRKTNIESVFVDTKVKPFPAFFNLFSKSSYNVSRFYHQQFEQLIDKTLAAEKFDMVLLEGLYVTPYISSIRANSSTKIIYRAHNVEFEIWERKSLSIKSIFKSNYMKSLARKLKRYEVSIFNKVDGIAAITERDKNRMLNLGCSVPVQVIPFGINVKDYQPTPVKQKSSLFYIGSMDWQPNQEAIKWFLKQVWGKVVKKNPDTRFYIAGRKIPQWLFNKKGKNLKILGEVESAIDFINDYEIMLVPLFAGSGMRIKIIEAMALGKTVIATSIAAEGIQYQNDENILIADTSAAFITSINNCLTDSSLVKRIGENARRMVERNYDNKVIVDNLVMFFKHVIG